MSTKRPELAVICITVACREEADRISSILLESRNAACVSVVDKVASSYWWQGKIDSSDEILLIVKTKASVVSRVIELVKKNHSYTVPEIIALPILSGNQDYLDWIRNEVTE
jgi:periplasmic divalent cation tolerance protein